MFKKILFSVLLFIFCISSSYAYLSDRNKSHINMVLDNYYIIIENTYSLESELSILKKIRNRVRVLKNIYFDKNKIELLEYIGIDINDRIDEVSLKFNSSSCTEYIVHEDIIASVFWVGEKENSSNAYISNKTSAWDGDWQKHFRQGLENSFYVALPYNDFDENGNRRSNSKDIPWYNSKIWGDDESIVKNRWVRISSWKTTVYAQWEDVGPILENDFDYVFGYKKPGNTFSLKAGIDLSPDAADYLGIDGAGEVDWTFVDDDCVPEGDWKSTITDSNINWK